MKLYTLLTLTAFTLANVKVQDTSNNLVNFGSKVGSFMETERVGLGLSKIPVNVLVTGGLKKTYYRRNEPKEANIKTQDASNNIVNFGNKIGSFVEPGMTGLPVTVLPSKLEGTKLIKVEEPIKEGEEKEAMIKGSMPNSPQALGAAFGPGTTLYKRCIYNCRYSRYCCLYNFCRWRDRFCGRMFV